MTHRIGQIIITNPVDGMCCNSKYILFIQHKGRNIKWNISSEI